MRLGDSSLSPDKNREEESYANLVKDSNIITTNSDLKRGDSEMISPLIPESKATKKNGVSPNLIIGIQTMQISGKESDKYDHDKEAHTTMDQAVAAQLDHPTLRILPQHLDKIFEEKKEKTSKLGADDKDESKRDSDNQENDGSTTNIVESSHG